MSDMINHPDHYTVGGIETIEAVKAKLTPEQFIGYLLGTALVYLMRANHKGDSLTDIKKADWYVDRLARETEKIVTAKGGVAKEPWERLVPRMDSGDAEGFQPRSRPVLDAFENQKEAPLLDDDKGIALVSVKTYGAKGDGVTDDTLALQNAVTSMINSDGSIMLTFPPGIYKINT